MRKLKHILALAAIFSPICMMGQAPEYQRIPEPVMFVAPKKASHPQTTEVKKKDTEPQEIEKKQEAKIKSEEKIVPQTTPNDRKEPTLLLGLRAGMTRQHLMFSDEELEAYSHSATTHGLFGIFAKVPLGVHWALRPEVVFDSRSDLMTFEDISYKLKAHYFDLRLPVTFSIPLGEHFLPYLLVAPHIDLVTGGTISYSDLNFPAGMSVDLSKSNITSSSMGLMIGGGIEWRINTKQSYVSVALEAGYNWGLTNTFAENEIEGSTTADASQIINPFLGAHLWKGTRKWGGWEVALQVAVPIAYKKAKIIETTKVPDPILQPLSHGKDTVVIINKDTIYVMSETRQVITDYQSKECYSIGEIHHFIDWGYDISDKRICLFNINFAFDSYMLGRDSEDKLLDLLILMRSYPEMTLTVYGHTDSRGTVEYNLRLSEYRANAVAAYLIGNGINPSRIKTYGLGKSFPLSTDDNEESHMRNRRVEIEVNNIGRKYNK